MATSRANLVEYLCALQFGAEVWAALSESGRDRKRMAMGAVLDELESLGLMRAQKTPAT